MKGGGKERGRRKRIFQGQRKKEEKSKRNGS